MNADVFVHIFNYWLKTTEMIPFIWQLKKHIYDKNSNGKYNIKNQTYACQELQNAFNETGYECENLLLFCKMEFRAHSIDYMNQNYQNKIINLLLTIYAVRFFFLFLLSLFRMHQNFMNRVNVFSRFFFFLWLFFVCSYLSIN